MADLTVGLVTGLILGTLRRLGVINDAGVPAGGGPTYNSTTDVLGGTPDFVDAIVLGNSGTASQNVRLEQTASNTLTAYGGDGSAQTTTIKVGATKNLEFEGGAGSSSNGGDVNITGGAGAGGTNTGGFINFLGGTATVGNGGAIGQIGAGENLAAGAVYFAGGVATDGAGGEVTLKATTGFGTNKDGGSLNLVAGPSTGTGVPGQIRCFNGYGSDGVSRFGLAKGANVASANTVTLGTDGNFFKITGSTTINGIVTLGWQAGSVIHLMFTGALTVTHASGAPGAGAVALLLNAASNMTTAANNTLTLVYDGTNWVELARKV